MASICMTQVNYKQHHHLQQQFQLLNGSNAGILLLQQQQQQQATTTTNYSKRPAIVPPTKAPLGTSHLQNILPRTYSSSGGLIPMLPKKKYNYANMPYGEQMPSVARRNARERNRVKQVNNGFQNLRQHLPQTVINTLSHGGRGASKKLSKVDTLRIAVEYIRGLQDLLEDAGATSTNLISSSSAAVFQLDESSNDGSNFDDYSQMGSPVPESTYQTHQPHYHSEASVSPTPSYTDSDISIGGVNYLQPITLEESKQHQQQQQQQQQQQSTVMVSQQMQFKFEPFDAYEQPNDEELLDYISSWQQQ